MSEDHNFQQIFKTLAEFRQRLTALENLRDQADPFVTIDSCFKELKWVRDNFEDGFDTFLADVPRSARKELVHDLNELYTAIADTPQSRVVTVESQNWSTFSVSVASGNTVASYDFAKVVSTFLKNWCVAYDDNYDWYVVYNVNESVS